MDHELEILVEAACFGGPIKDPKRRREIFTNYCKARLIEVEEFAKELRSVILRQEEFVELVRTGLDAMDSHVEETRAVLQTVYDSSLEDFTS